MPFPRPHYKKFLDVMHADGVVHGLARSGCTMEEIVVVLANQKNELYARIEELEQIAPKKIRVGDKVFVWRCPTELIPESK